MRGGGPVGVVGGNNCDLDCCVSTLLLRLGLP
eukprot:CAMPEP_0201982636 /NCGR_PEP_ID=MMETSP0904-20121228/77499_1 /ASSEMBLY_ACC=CAM_ASM_000553 /TAXON_ID=420261 /ORGANISM="Thalassiosira antarctica, Strain CCMP982" /LENGTH=31 /DNA_ID= /DNA_START= /DNA_END= /DNA_ORIENTATION=